MRTGLSWLRILADLVHFVCLGSRSRSSLAAEHLFLRKQLALSQERKVKPRRADNQAIKVRGLTTIKASRQLNQRLGSKGAGWVLDGENRALISLLLAESELLRCH